MPQSPVQVAARDAEDNINDDVENVDKVLLVSGIFREKCCLGATLFMCENAFAAPHILCNKTKNLLYLQKRRMLWIRDLQTR